MQGAELIIKHSIKQPVILIQLTQSEGFVNQRNSMFAAVIQAPASQPTSQPASQPGNPPALGFGICVFLIFLIFLIPLILLNAWKVKSEGIPKGIQQIFKKTLQV